VGAELLDLEHEAKRRRPVEAVQELHQGRDALPGELRAVPAQVRGAAVGPARQPAAGVQPLQLGERERADLRFGRIVTLEIEVRNILVNLV
jgi:hypothetical protein